MKITENYVSFEVAKLLKEKGFREDCIATYSLLSKQLSIEEVYQDWTSSWSSVISAPTHQMACKWLREVHNIHIIVFRYDNSAFPYIWYIFSHNKEKPQKANSYEEAVEAALKYVLENLI